MLAGLSCNIPPLIYVGYVLDPARIVPDFSAAKSGTTLVEKVKDDFAASALLSAGPAIGGSTMPVAPVC